MNGIKSTVFAGTCYTRLNTTVQFCLICIMLLPLNMTGQTIPVSSILLSAQQDATIEYQENHVDYMVKHQRSLPFAEQLSFRTESDRFHLGYQEYLARLNVNGINEMKHQRHLHAAELQTAQSAKRVYVHDALVLRYLAIVYYRSALQQLAVQKELQLVYDDEIQVLTKIARLSTDADVDELIKIEYDRDDLLVKLAELNGIVDHQLHNMSSWLGNESFVSEVDTTGFIRPAQLEFVLNGLSASVDQHPEVVEIQQKMEELDAEYRLEKANGTQLLDFLQVRYNDEPLETFRRKFSVGFGINIPYRGSSRVKLGNIKIEKDEENQNLQLYLHELAWETDQELQLLKALRTKYEVSYQQWQESQSRFSTEQYTGLRMQGPMILLRARELQLKRELDLIEIEQEMFEHYINILDWTGQLSVEPYVNYLSKELETY